MKKKIMLGAVIVVTACLLDRITKLWAALLNEPKVFIDGLVGFRYVRNTGVAFSMLSDMTWLVNILSVVMIGAVILLILREKGFGGAAQAGMWLIVAGGLGNLYDRLTMGYVIDFIELLFMDFAIFNVADICVCCGAVLAGIAIFFGDKKNEKTTEVA